MAGRRAGAGTRTGLGVVATEPGARRDDDACALKPREAEVLALVAQGLTNRQIGERLFISEKTASAHVSRLLAKLGASTRGEAAAVVSSPTPDGRSPSARPEVITGKPLVRLSVAVIG